LLKVDLAEQVVKLKAQEGDEIQVHGSGHPLQTLFSRDLVDTLRIWHFPVVIGTGKCLFGEGTIPRSFRLVDTQLSTTGAVLHVYERGGDLRYGEVEVGRRRWSSTQRQTSDRSPATLPVTRSHKGVSSVGNERCTTPDSTFRRAWSPLFAKTRSIA
jgi:RibD C-terminal domain